MADNQSESIDTASSSLVEDSLNISFENITYTVRHGLTRRNKTILKEISGSFSSGELSVIVGQSGAGKSSFMDILAGYTQPTSGAIYINGRLRNVQKFRRRSCYVLQDDRLQELLTLEESLHIAADLKLGNHISRAQKLQRVEEIIDSLDLSEARHTRACNLSGGEKKRLAISLELVSDPLVLILDEPTSGLDSSIASKIVELLRDLARQGRTVIATLHQPSAAVLDLVDRLYGMVDGQCAYMGSVAMLLPFLAEINQICPPFSNKVDFLIELCGDKEAHDLVSLSQNGKDTRWIANVPSGTDNVENNSYSRTNSNKITTLPPPKDDPTNKILLKLKSTYSTSFWKQFAVLTRRSLLSYWRNPHYMLMITGIHCAMALVVGILFFNIGNEPGKLARHNYNGLFFGLMFLMYTAFSSVSVTFPHQFPVVRREHFNRWYMTGAYYLSTLVSALPTQTVCTLSYAVITYWLTGQPHDFFRFIGYCWTLMLVTYVGFCIGLLNGSIFNIKNGVTFGPFFIMPFVIFSGFFLLLKDAPFVFHWLFHASFLKHGLVALSLIMFGMNRPKYNECPEIYCHYSNPMQILIENDTLHEQLWVALFCLMCISVVVNFATYFVLKIRLRSKW